MKYFKLASVLLVSVLVAQAAFAKQVNEESPIDFKSVEAAFSALESNPEAQLTEYEGWTIFKLKGEGNYVLWSFAPPEHSAHPSAIRRVIVKRGDEISISMDALCESNKFECDDLIEQFKQLNEKIKKKVKAKFE